jgi:hypothetical protein
MKLTTMSLYLLFTIISSFLLIVGLPAMSIWATVELRQKKDIRFLLKILTVGAGFLAGMVVAWIVAVVDMSWPLPIWETVYAAGHSEIYGHEAEHAAETIVLFVLFGGDLGAIAAGTGPWLIRKFRVRRIDIA